LSPAESDIRPNRVQIRGASPAGGEAVARPTGRQEFWGALATLALGVLVWEWWVYWRGEG
ncbi:MAG: hypothetical protein D6796_15515, partial [Caldilineae bacterium]